MAAGAYLSQPGSQHIPGPLHQILFMFSMHSPQREKWRQPIRLPPSLKLPWPCPINSRRPQPARRTDPHIQSSTDIQDIIDQPQCLLLASNIQRISYHLGIWKLFINFRGQGCGVGVEFGKRRGLPVRRVERWRTRVNASGSVSCELENDGST